MKSKKLYIFTIIVCSLLISTCIYNIFTFINDRKNTLKLEEELKNINEENINNNENNSLFNPPSNEEDSYWNYIDLPFLQVDFSKLLLQNNETIAWIRVNGTSINYPIVQTNDNEYYLTHSFDKAKNTAGWIFLDYRNDINNLNYNNIVYGHARKDNIMFGTLKNVLTKDWYDNKNNHIIKISTPKENMIFQIFSTYTIPTESYYITTSFLNKDSFQKFLETISNTSIYDFNTSLNINDKILTLSTCKDNSKSRIVVHSKLIKRETRL